MLRLGRLSRPAIPCRADGTHLGADAWITLALLAVHLFSPLCNEAAADGDLSGGAHRRDHPGRRPSQRFSNPGVITVGVLFMVAGGMYSTGCISVRRAGQSVE